MSNLKTKCNIALHGAAFVILSIFAGYVMAGFLNVL